MLPVVPLIGALAVLAACSGGSSAPKASPTSASPSATSARPKPVAAPATCPLTGKPPTKNEDLHRVPLAVKIDNIDLARPQAGINHADLIIEETVEGGLTRLFAVFQCDGSGVIGPVRSARTTDAYLLRLFHGNVVFGYSGSSPKVARDITAQSHAVLLSYDANGSLFYRSSSRPAPHNVYTSTERLLKAGVARKKHMHAPRPFFKYAATAPKGRRVKDIALRWSGYASAGWTWTGHHWNRIQNGTPDMLASGQRASAANVVVMRIKTRYLGLHDVLGNASPDDVVTGKGRVWVFRNGRLIGGTWKRKTLNSPLRLIRNGKAIPLQPGQTWIELLPSPDTISFH
jgi:hypothetical protein